MSEIQLRGSHSMSKKCPLVGFELWGVYLILASCIQIFLANFPHSKLLDLSLMISCVALI